VIKKFQKHRKMRPSRPNFCWAIFDGFFDGFFNLTALTIFDKKVT
jgi:hypothetical protein